MSSQRTAYRLRIVRGSGRRSVLGIDYSHDRIFRQALMWIPVADDAELDPVDVIDVLYREPGSVQWRVYDDFWRRGRDDFKPADREVRPADSTGEGGNAAASPNPTT